MGWCVLGGGQYEWDQHGCARLSRGSIGLLKLRRCVGHLGRFGSTTGRKLGCRTCNLEQNTRGTPAAQSARHQLLWLSMPAETLAMK